MLYRIGYIISWSIGLLYATFPHFFDGEMSFDYRNLTLGEACDTFIFPFVMAMVLFLVDVIYGYVKEMIDGRYTHVISVITFLVLFLLGFIISISSENPNTARFCFIISWVCLSVMKFLKTDLYDDKRYPQAVRIDNN